MRKSKFSLEGIGLIVIFGGALIKVWMHSMHANGALIDLARSTLFLGIMMVVVGLIKRRNKS